jgi:sugar phosphate isomerase/epimerase
MRLGGPVFAKWDGAEAWAAAVRAAGYRAAYCPLPLDAPEAVARKFEEVAVREGIVVAEVGTWSNPLSPDDRERAEAMEKCKRGLKLADEVGARCCVNIAGSRGKKWDGPSRDDLTPEAFAMIVDVVRDIIDAVRPTRTFYTLEPMPWMYPDTADSYLELIKAVDRERFAVHFDPVNVVSSPQRYFANGALIREWFEKLGRWMKSCHAKDILLQDRLTVHLDEVCPGRGALDYSAYLRELARLDPEMPLMLEHMTEEADYLEGAGYIRKVARAEGIEL